MTREDAFAAAFFRAQYRFRKVMYPYLPNLHDYYYYYWGGRTPTPTAWRIT